MGRLQALLLLSLCCGFLSASEADVILRPGLYFDDQPQIQPLKNQRHKYIMLLVHSGDYGFRAELAIISTPPHDRNGDLTVFKKGALIINTSQLAFKKLMMQGLLFQGSTWLSDTWGTVTATLQQFQQDHATLTCLWEHPRRKGKNARPSLTTFKLRYYLPLIGEHNQAPGNPAGCKIPPSAFWTSTSFKKSHVFGLEFHPHSAREKTGAAMIFPWQGGFATTISRESYGIIQTCDGMSLSTSHHFGRPVTQLGRLFSIYDAQAMQYVMFGHLRDSHTMILDTQKPSLMDDLSEWLTGEPVPVPEPVHKNVQPEGYVFFPAKLKEHWKLKHRTSPDLASREIPPSVLAPDFLPTPASHTQYSSKLKPFFSIHRFFLNAKVLISVYFVSLLCHQCFYIIEDLFQRIR